MLASKTMRVKEYAGRQNESTVMLSHDAVPSTQKRRNRVKKNHLRARLYDDNAGTRAS